MECSSIIYQNKMVVSHMVQVNEYLYIPQKVWCFRYFIILTLEVTDEDHCSIRYHVANLVHQVTVLIMIRYCCHIRYNITGMAPCEAMIHRQRKLMCDSRSLPIPTGLVMASSLVVHGDCKVFKLMYNMCGSYG